RGERPARDPSGAATERGRRPGAGARCGPRGRDHYRPAPDRLGAGASGRLSANPGPGPGPGQAARPRKTINARPTRTSSWSGRWPTRSRKLARGIVVTLSIIRLDAWSRPLVPVGSITRRVNGACTGFVVRGQTVTEAVASNRSSWMMRTGRGLPV